MIWRGLGGDAVITGIGTDIIEISRITKALENERFLLRCFTPREIEHFKSKGFRRESIAGGFCAKEAVAKAMGTGIGKLSFQDIEIIRENNGKPIVVLSENGLDMAKKRGISSVFITISHCRDYATASCVAEG